MDTPRPRTRPLGGQLRGHPGVPAPPSRRKRPGSWGGVGAELRPARSGGRGEGLGHPPPSPRHQNGRSGGQRSGPGRLSPDPSPGARPVTAATHRGPGSGSVPGHLEPARHPAWHPTRHPAWPSARALPGLPPPPAARAGSPLCQESRSRRKVTSHMPYRGRFPGDGPWPRAAAPLPAPRSQPPDSAPLSAPRRALGGSSLPAPRSCHPRGWARRRSPRPPAAPRG